jgi:hypothetical protein
MVEWELKEGKKGKIALRLCFVVVRNSEILQKFGLFFELLLLRRFICAIAANCNLLTSVSPMYDVSTPNPECSALFRS